MEVRSAASPASASGCSADASAAGCQPSGSSAPPSWLPALPAPGNTGPPLPSNSARSASMDANRLSVVACREEASMSRGAAAAAPPREADTGGREGSTGAAPARPARIASTVPAGSTTFSSALAARGEAVMLSGTTDPLRPCTRTEGTEDSEFECASGSRGSSGAPSPAVSSIFSTVRATEGASGAPVCEGPREPASGSATWRAALALRMMAEGVVSSDSLLSSISSCSTSPHSSSISSWP
mmetsp:Transcript_28769/g.73262  ORF Transcript_28769/g.73262 Transcript_28769/m.73262 type:complete len:241 (-) Transcript_28769:579-1301(-)